ncbi:CocE/NonD family hydrolase [Allorhizobium sp. BGMRC 0089]|uniref:CocE/NonD family hydrolase n=1 Tax=Allorhizobium sonneratiae TaxID=2934936 RepID=UPI0020334161|nr:CocE/NonD family hydrolase [Allorhizobium sonneratiae]MCM2292398.1 CocE/NonD family hydrolase [Allorhizobium sonneratiae]
MNIMKKLDGLDVIFRKAAPIEKSAYPGLNERSYVLEKGSVHLEGGMPLKSDIRVDQDVEVAMRDGVKLRVDVYRPTEEGQYPVIMGWSPYGKRGSVITNGGFGHPTRMDVPLEWEDGINKFEGPNPGYWVAHGYVVLAPDSRGIFHSEGDVHAWGRQEPEDEYDLIEWAGQQPWSNGKVGLTGNSMLAMSQWFVAAKHPPHLAAIAPWEGACDIYRDTSCRGGIPEMLFSNGIFSRLCGNGLLEDIPAMTAAHPLLDDYWRTKIAPVETINVPAYVVAAWTNLLHTEGTFRGWMSMASKDKWLRVHNTHEWTDYYTPAHVDDLRRFFDRYLKDIDNGWEATPRVRLCVFDPGNGDVINRSEAEFPLKRQVVKPLYLGLEKGSPVLLTQPQAEQAKVSYDVHAKEGVSFTIKFDELTELTGYFNLKLWVEAEGNDDIDLFAFVRKRDCDGKIRECPVVTERTHIGPNGRLRVSLRATDPERSSLLQPWMDFNKPMKLRPGEIVPVEIGFWPYGIRWQPGETLELIVTGTDLLVRPEFPQIPPIPTINKGRHVIHFGGDYDSKLLTPYIPGA